MTETIFVRDEGLCRYLFQGVDFYHISNTLDAKYAAYTMEVPLRIIRVVN